MKLQLEPFAKFNKFYTNFHLIHHTLFSYQHIHTAIALPLLQTQTHLTIVYFHSVLMWKIDKLNKTNE